ncbi:hypothetical protein D3C85_1273300 [compost metagenome]
MATSFSSTVGEWVKGVEGAVEAVVHGSTQEVAAIMQVPGPSVANPSGGEGGAMPVQDGFLRASLVATHSGDFPAATTKPDGDGRYSYSPGPVNLSIVGSPVPGRVTLTYTANYSRFMEVRYGFVRLAAQRWPSIVSEEVAKARENVARNRSR